MHRYRAASKVHLDIGLAETPGTALFTSTPHVADAEREAIISHAVLLMTYIE
jgi:hypothetical protein